MKRHRAGSKRSKLAACVRRLRAEAARLHGIGDMRRAKSYERLAAMSERQYEAEGGHRDAIAPPPPSYLPTEPSFASQYAPRHEAVTVRPGKRSA
jgi:hypothetical protein